LGQVASSDRSPDSGEGTVIEGRTVIGRRRFLYVSPSAKPSDINWSGFQLLTNYRVQGSAADVLKLAMIKVSERLPEGARLRACVHDELILSNPAHVAHETLENARAAMIEAFVKLFSYVPVEVDGKIRQHWGEK
jgi:DNA polymerase I